MFDCAASRCQPSVVSAALRTTLEEARAWCQHSLLVLEYYPFTWHWTYNLGNNTNVSKVFVDCDFGKCAVTLCTLRKQCSTLNQKHPQDSRLLQTVHKSQKENTWTLLTCVYSTTKQAFRLGNSCFYKWTTKKATLVASCRWQASVKLARWNLIIGAAKIFTNMI